jgi:HD-GYP domain-containing protein (c-di-GMP phosphodiesterase class II)
MCIAEFVKTAVKLFSDEPLTILISEGRFWVQGEKLRYPRTIANVIHDMLDFFRTRGIGGLRFQPSFKETSEQEILTFTRLLIGSAEHDNPGVWFAQKAADAGLQWIEALEVTNPLNKKNMADNSEKVKTIYFNALASVREVAQKISLEGRPGVRKAKRVVQSMVDFVMEDEALFLSASIIKDYDDYTYKHSVNVAVLAVCLGKRIGLSRTSLEKLGICGLFHDLGKVEISREILHKPTSLSDNEWVEMQKHPLTSVRRILNMNVSHELRGKILLAPFEHHQKYDLSGYPNPHYKKNISLFGRILQITDCYDALTSRRPYRSFAYSPDQALKKMLTTAGTDFDPILIKVFAKMMGIYPVGTLLQLDTGEVGLVTQRSSLAANEQLQIQLLTEDGNGGLKRGEMVPLEERALENEPPQRSVLRSFNPASYGIQPANFIL